MSNISNTNSTYTTGGIDTRTTLDGTFDATFQQMNGAASADIAIETVLGDGPTLKGNLADLVARLAVALNADGQVKIGTNGVFNGLTSLYGLIASSSTQIVPKNIRPIGTIDAFLGTTAPTHWLLCDATARSNTTYVDLFDVLVPSISQFLGAATTFATTDVDTSTDRITEPAHGLANGTVLYFTTTTTLPAPLTANTKYFVVGTATNDFQVSLTSGGAAENLTSQGAGTHSFYTTFNIDLRGRAIVMVDGAANRITSASTNGANADTLGGVGGAETHTLDTASIPSHSHLENVGTNGGSAAWAVATGAVAATPNYDVANAGRTTAQPQIATATTGGGGAHSNTQPWIALNYIVYAGI